MAHKLKPSEWTALGSLALGAIGGGGAWWLWPGAHWGFYAGGGFIVGALLYGKLIELFAYWAMMDRGGE